MKVFGITGFKNSGKTTLILRLSRELSQMGFEVGIIKHASGDIDFPDTDTSKYKSQAPFVCAIASKETEIILRGEKTIEDMLAYVDCDIVLLEGFKQKQTFPKIVCLRNKSEESELFDGLQLATASFIEGISDFHIENDDHIKKLASLVIERSFKLPNLNCGHCGYKTCSELAREIVSGNETVDRCVSLNPPISVEINGTAYPLNPFTSNLFKKIIQGMLSSLKGFKKGTIKIEIP